MSYAIRNSEDQEEEVLVLVLLEEVVVCSSDSLFEESQSFVRSVIVFSSDKEYFWPRVVSGYQFEPDASHWSVKEIVNGVFYLLNHTSLFVVEDQKAKETLNELPDIPEPQRFSFEDSTLRLFTGPSDPIVVDEVGH